MHCSQCGREAKPGARFCAGCGAPFRSAQPAAARDAHDDDVSTTATVSRQGKPQLAPQPRTQPPADIHTAGLERPRTAVPPLPLRAAGSKDSANTLSWVGLLIRGHCASGRRRGLRLHAGPPKETAPSIAPLPSVENRAPRTLSTSPQAPMPSQATKPPTNSPHEPNVKKRSGCPNQSRGAAQSSAWSRCQKEIRASTSRSAKEIRAGTGRSAKEIRASTSPSAKEI